ncbi:hypothetical protein ACE1CB_03700 [Aerosakkonema sp. BLCC-F2]
MDDFIRHGVKVPVGDRLAVGDASLSLTQAKLIRAAGAKADALAG